MYLNFGIHEFRKQFYVVVVAKFMFLPPKSRSTVSWIGLSSLAVAVTDLVLFSTPPPTLVDFDGSSKPTPTPDGIVGDFFTLDDVELFGFRLISAFVGFSPCFRLSSSINFSFFVCLL